MLIIKYIVLDNGSPVYDEETKATALFSKKEASKIAKWLLKDGAKTTQIIEFRYNNA